MRIAKDAEEGASPLIGRFRADISHRTPNYGEPGRPGIVPWE